MESLCTIGSDRIEERQRVLVGQFADRVSQWRRGEGAGSDDDVVPLLRRQAADFGPVDLDQRMLVQRLGDGGRKTVAVDRQRAAGGHLVGIGRAHDQRTQPAHLGVQQADGIVGGIVGAETSWSRPVRPGPRYGAPRSSGKGASRAGSRGYRHWRSARRLPNRQGRRQPRGRCQSGECWKSCAQG